MRIYGQLGSGSIRRVGIELLGRGARPPAQRTCSRGGAHLLAHTRAHRAQAVDPARVDGSSEALRTTASMGMPALEGRDGSRVAPTVFQLLELLVQDFMEYVPASSVPNITASIGAFARYTGLGVNSSLTAVGFLWNVADALARYLGPKRGGGPPQIDRVLAPGCFPAEPHVAIFAYCVRFRRAQHVVRHGPGVRYTFGGLPRMSAGCAACAPPPQGG